MDESQSPSLPPPHVVVVAYDATRGHNEHELRLTVSGVRMRGDILRGGDFLLVLSVLHTVTNPMGYQTKACADSFAGTSSRYLEEEVLNKVALYESRLLDSAGKCNEMGVNVNVKITTGTPAKFVILQEVISSKVSWVILDRHLRRDLKFYLKHIPCKIAIIQDRLCVKVVKPFHTHASSKSASEQKSFYSLERPVQPSSATYFAPLISHDSSNS